LLGCFSPSTNSEIKFLNDSNIGPQICEGSRFIPHISEIKPGCKSTSSHARDASEIRLLSRAIGLLLRR
jgi:hypothetical protein